MGLLGVTVAEQITGRFQDMGYSLMVVAMDKKSSRPPSRPIGLSYGARHSTCCVLTKFHEREALEAQKTKYLLPKAGQLWAIAHWCLGHESERQCGLSDVVSMIYCAQT